MSYRNIYSYTLEFSKGKRCFPTLISCNFQNSLEFGDQNKAKIPRGHLKSLRGNQGLNLSLPGGISFQVSNVCVSSLKAPSSFLTLSCLSSFLTPSPILKLVSLIIFMKFQLQKQKDLRGSFRSSPNLSFSHEKNNPQRGGKYTKVTKLYIQEQNLHFLLPDY